MPLSRYQKIDSSVTEFLRRLKRRVRKLMHRWLTSKQLLAKKITSNRYTEDEAS